MKILSKQNDLPNLSNDIKQRISQGVYPAYQLVDNRFCVILHAHILDDHKISFSKKVYHVFYMDSMGNITDNVKLKNIKAFKRSLIVDAITFV